MKNETFSDLQKKLKTRFCNMESAMTDVMTDVAVDASLGISDFLGKEILSEKSFREKVYETVEVNVPLLDVGITGGEQTGLDIFKKKIVKNMSKLNFRRVGNVVAKQEDWVRTEFYQARDDGSVVVNVYTENPPDFTDDDYKRKVAEYYSDYSFYTTQKPLRVDEDKIGTGYILCEAKNQCYLNPITFKFDRALSGDDRMILPREGDLVCLLPVHGKGGRIPEAKYWFICSEQFMKAWTLIVYRDHETLKKLASTEQELRKKVFSGNFTMTNGYRKWILSCYQSGLISTPEEIEKRFWVVRGERLARDYVHVYSALVLMIRYREFPCEYNVPNVINYAPTMSGWDLPAGWIETLTQTYGLQVHGFFRKQEIEVFDRTLPPKGTTYPSVA